MGLCDRNKKIYFIGEYTTIEEKFEYQIMVERVSIVNLLTGGENPRTPVVLFNGV